MNWDAISAVGEIVGAAAVVLTLIYLAVQIRQNNKHLAQEAQRARAQSFRENMGRMADYAAALTKDAGGEQLTEVEAFQLDRIWVQNLWGFQTSFQQLRREEIEFGANWFRDSLETMPSLRAAWEQHRKSFQSEFVEYMDEKIFNAE